MQDYGHSSTIQKIMNEANQKVLIIIKSCYIATIKCDTLDL